MEKSGQILNMGLDWAPCQLSRGQKERGPRSRVGGPGQEKRGLDRMPKARTPNLPSFQDLPSHSADHLVPVSKSSVPRSGPTGVTKRPVCLGLRGFPSALSVLVTLCPTGKGKGKSSALGGSLESVRHNVQRMG